MKPIVGWTMLSRDEMRRVERSIASGERDTRDEIGFLLLHQGFADRFFPGTSVLHTRVRYALFLPWLYLRAAKTQRHGRTLESAIRHLLIELAIRLKRLGCEPYDVIGGDKLGQLTSQPPDRVYWTALRTWGLLLPSVESRSEALKRLQAASRPKIVDDEGESLDDVTTEVFAGLPRPPSRWEDAGAPLHFKMPQAERGFLRGKLMQLQRRDGQPALLANLVKAGVPIPASSVSLPKALDAYADVADRQALAVARDAAALAAIGRAIYGALVEELRKRDGKSTTATFPTLLRSHFDAYGDAASRCDLDAIEELLPDIIEHAHVRRVLHETRAFVRGGKPDAFLALQDSYRHSEVTRKTVRRARLIDTELGFQRRTEWDSERHNTTPLHYRWRVASTILADLSASQ